MPKTALQTQTCEPAERSYQDLPVASVPSPGHLRNSLAPSIDAAICNRVLPIGVADWLNDLPVEHLPQGRYVLDPDEVSACLAHLFAAKGVQSAPALNWLCEDAAQLARCICAVTGTTRPRLRVEPVFDNACAKFHVDNVVARLICTYRGPGTQISLEGTASDVTNTVTTGSPILLKGLRWPGAEDLKLRHRSPPISGTGLSRLVLVVEGISDSEISPEYDRLYEH
ncbi:MAG: DUF1826 domain-containing protein [Henriciella sp.]|nr:DUF1826 domain-containing protein [Henriciella sp.]